MARIPDQELERLKRDVSLARLIEGQGRVVFSHFESGLKPGAAVVDFHKNASLLI
jgi:hypothetical protein